VRCGFVISRARAAYARFGREPNEIRAVAGDGKTSLLSLHRQGVGRRVVRTDYFAQLTRQPCLKKTEAGETSETSSIFAASAVSPKNLESETSETSSISPVSPVSPENLESETVTESAAASNNAASSGAVSLSHLSHQKLKKPDLSAHVDQTPIDLTREDHRKEALPPEAKARRFKVTLKSGGVLLHSAPSGLTRREAIELSKDWGEVAECVPCPPAEIREAQKSVGDTLIEACEGTSLGPDTFRALLDDDDLADIAAGLIPPRTLQAYAGSFAKRLPPHRLASGTLCGLRAL
jgi:hypothetical protein